MSAAVQLEFDLDALLPPTPIPAYLGRAPMHFTSGYFTIDELTEAFTAWVARNGSFGSHPRSHMWVGTQAHTAPIGVVTMHADLRCTVAYDHPRECSCVGALLHRTQCEPCEWVAVGDENIVVEAWHDHAWPGWRDLPVMPLKTEESPEAHAKLRQRWATVARRPPLITRFETTRYSHARGSSGAACWRASRSRRMNASWVASSAAATSRVLRSANE